VDVPHAAFMPFGILGHLKINLYSHLAEGGREKNMNKVDKW
jgi:hypothetical protein